MSRLAQILHGVSVTFISKSIGTLSHIMTTAYVAAYLPIEQFGLWTILSSLIILAPCFDLGIGGAQLRNRLTQLIDDQEEGRFYFFYIFTLMLILYSLIVLLLWSFQSLFGWSKLICGAISLMLLRMPFAMNSEGFYAHHETHIRGFLDGLEFVLLSGLVVACVKMKVAFEWLVILYFGFFVILAIVGFVLFSIRRRWRYYLKISSHFSLVEGRNFWLLNVVSFVLFTQLPTLVGYHYGTHVAGQFGLLYRPFSIVVGIQFAVLNPIWSHFTEAAHKGEHQWISSAHRHLLLFGILGTTLVVALLIPFHSRIIHIWTGIWVEQYGLASLLGLWVLLYGVINCYTILLNALSQVKLQLIVLFSLLPIVILLPHFVSLYHFLLAYCCILFIPLLFYSLFVKKLSRAAFE